MTSDIAPPKSIVYEYTIDTFTYKITHMLEHILIEANDDMGDFYVGKISEDTIKYHKLIPDFNMCLNILNEHFENKQIKVMSSDNEIKILILIKTKYIEEELYINLEKYQNINLVNVLKNEIVELKKQNDEYDKLFVEISMRLDKLETDTISLQLMSNVDTLHLHGETLCAGHKMDMPPICVYVNQYKCESNVSYNLEKMRKNPDQLEKLIHFLDVKKIIIYMNFASDSRNCGPMKNIDVKNLHSDQYAHIKRHWEGGYDFIRKNIIIMNKCNINISYWDR